MKTLFLTIFYYYSSEYIIVNTDEYSTYLEILKTNTCVEKGCIDFTDSLPYCLYIREGCDTLTLKN